ncbi:MAG TPA: hypothetical protein VLH10_12375 [Yinghuangia sp.]|nr:hypothetical protein [Yinghuangia sp.]
MLTRLGRVEPKLALSAAETRALAPLAQRWLDTGVSDLETRALLTQGLPHVVHSPRALLANRLTRKLPAPRNSPGTYARPLAECATCRDPLPRNQRTGICAHCSGAVARTSPAKPQPKAVAERVAVLRSVLASRRLGATAAT